MRPYFALIAVVWLLSDFAAAEESNLSVALVGLDDQRYTLTIPELDALPRVKISANEHGAPHAFEGALLGDVLAKSARRPAKQFMAWNSPMSSSSRGGTATRSRSISPELMRRCAPIG